MKRIAIGGLHTECSSYSPLQQVATDFTRTSGPALCDMVPFDFAAHMLQAIPLFHDRSVPGGPVSAETYQTQKHAFLAELEAKMPLDGVLLLMHGAMFVPGIDDPEGDFITAVRATVGPDAIMSAAFDLHGQMTAQICETLDAFAAYRTAPHIDTSQTYARAAHMLADALNTGQRPKVCWEPVPILVSGEMSSTFVAPCDRLYAALSDLDRRAGVLDCNLMIGYVWADSPRATAAAVVTALDPVAGQRAAAKIAQSYRDVRHELVFDMEAHDLPTALDRVTGHSAILADSGDNPTAGGVGDRADVLDAALCRGIRGALFAGIADPVAFDRLAEGADEILLGGALGGGGPKIKIRPQDVNIHSEIAIINVAENTILVTRKRRPFHNFQDFDDLGLSLNDYPLLVVKSGYLSPDIRRLDRLQIMALTDGAVCQNFTSLTNLHRPNGIWPFSVAP